MDESCVEVALDGSHKNQNKEEESHIDEKSNDAAGSSPNGRSSPEANCPICLGKPENKSFTDSCLHQFCFTCLLEWSKVKAECPLCKQSFKSIIHNVRSIEDYEQYYLSTAPAEETLLGIFQLPRYEPDRRRESFRYRTTAVSTYLDYFVRLEDAISNHVIPTVSSHSASTHWQRRRQNGTSDFRRNVYQQGLWVQRTRDVTGRVRDCSPEFYRENPALVHRLVPWLNRELNVLCNGNEPHVQFVMNRILELITQIPIRSIRFASTVSEHFGRHTEHFVHEFYSFASSPFDLMSYDRFANYVGRDALAHEVVSDDDDDGNDSDVQVVALLTPTSPVRSIHLDSDSDDCVVVDSVPPRQPTPEVITLESEPDDDVVQVNIHIETDHNRPGPSRRPSIKRNWLVKNVQMEKSSNDNVNVSINIAHSSRTRSSSSEDSLSSWTPSTSKSVTTKSKVKSNKRKKTVKSKSGTTRNKSKSKASSKVEKDRSPSPIVTSRKRRSSVVIKSCSEDKSDDDSNKLEIDTDHYSTSDTNESEYKPRLRSVVFKSTIKSEPAESNVPSPTVSVSYWNECGHNYNYESDMEDCSRGSRADPYGPSCSHHSSSSRRYSSSSPEYRPDLKFKYSKKRSKRQAYW